MSEKPKQQPSIGRVVHFVNGDQHVPALITDPNHNDQGECALVAAFDPEGAPATWHWPEYVQR